MSLIIRSVLSWHTHLYVNNNKVIIMLHTSAYDFMQSLNSTSIYDNLLHPLTSNISCLTQPSLKACYNWSHLWWTSRYLFSWWTEPSLTFTTSSHSPTHRKTSSQTGTSSMYTLSFTQNPLNFNLHAWLITLAGTRNTHWHSRDCWVNVPNPPKMTVLSHLSD